MAQCWQKLKLTEKRFKTVVKKCFPSDWLPMNSGQPRSLKKADPVVQNQIQIIKNLVSLPNHTKHGTMKKARELGIPRKRYYAIYEKLYEGKQWQEDYFILSSLDN